MPLLSTMKKVFKLWLFIGLALTLLYALVWLYERYATNGDGYLGALNIHVLFRYISLLVSIPALLSLGLASGRNWLANVSLSLVTVFIFWCLAELLCFGLIRLEIVKAPRPVHSRLLLNKEWKLGRRPFWGDFDRVVGRWRLPDDTLTSRICTGDSIYIQTNRFGMRDKERTIKNLSNRKRVVLLGDSFVEGYVVQARQRYAELLETATGNEHLNFGINSASAINYYLNYNKLARRFEHDVVLVSLLPANDFEDYDASKKLELLRYPVYRPYWEGTFPRVRLRYSLADITQSCNSLAGSNKPIQTQQVVDSVYTSLSITDRLRAELLLNSYLYSCVVSAAANVAAYQRETTGSFAVDNFGRTWPSFAYSLKRLAVAAHGKTIIALLVPIEADLRAFDKTHKNELAAQLKPLCRTYGITLIDLLPVFHALGQKRWQTLYIPCDGHLSPRGEQFMATFLLHNSTYCKAIGYDPDPKLTAQNNTNRYKKGLSTR